MTPTEYLLQHFDKTDVSDHPDQHNVNFEPNSRNTAVILTVDRMFKLVEAVTLSFDKEEGKMYVVFNCTDCEDAISIPESVMDESDFAIFKRTWK